jgi:helix-turn-helix protein
MVSTEKVEDAENALRNMNAKRRRQRQITEKNGCVSQKETKVLKEPKCNFVRK